MALLEAAQRNRPVAVPAAEAPLGGASAVAADEPAADAAAACPAPPAAAAAAAAAVAAAATAASSSSASDGDEDTQMKDEQLYDAARNGKTAELTQLLAAGADPNGHEDEVRACTRTASLPAASLRAPAAPMQAARRSPPAPRRCST